MKGGGAENKPITKTKKYEINGDLSEKLDEIIELLENSKPVNLGTGTSFDVSSYEGYRNFTVDNFIIGALSGNNGVSGYSTANSAGKVEGFLLQKNYDAESGTLTISGNTQEAGCWDTDQHWNGYVIQTLTCFAYLVR